MCFWCGHKKPRKLQVSFQGVINGTGEFVRYNTPVLNPVVAVPLLSSRLYCRLRSFTESAVRFKNALLAGCTAGGELHPALKSSFRILSYGRRIIVSSIMRLRIL